MMMSKSRPVTDVKGVHDLYFKFTSDNGKLVNIDWWQFK